MRQVIPNIDDTFTEEGGPGTVAAEVFEQFIWVTTGVNEVSAANVYRLVSDVVAFQVLFLVE